MKFDMLLDDRKTPTTIIEGPLRVSVLTERLLRLEYSSNYSFEDSPTLRVVNRNLGTHNVDVYRNNGCLTVRTQALDLNFDGKRDERRLTKDNLSVRFAVGDSQVVWHPDLQDPKNLGGTARTLDRVFGNVIRPPRSFGGKGSDKPLSLDSGLVSRSGWSAIDDSDAILLAQHKDGEWIVRPREHDVQDLYLFAYGLDFRGALRDGARVFGRQPLPPRFALGYWWSRYWAYRDEELKDLVRECNRLEIPLDVLVIDMDWHLQNWTGFTWDRSYFPYPRAFLDWMKHQEIEVGLNLHPAEGIGPHEELYEKCAERLGFDSTTGDYIPFDSTDQNFVEAYFEVLLRALERDGVRFWWLDWQQGDTSQVPGLDPLPWLNHLHWRDQERTYPHRRPLCFSRYGGIGAGRYPIGFSGDTHVAWETLAYLPQFTATSANVLYGYWSHDIGGHYEGKLSPELFLRWMQFGVYSPVLRTHGSKQSTNDRRFWHTEPPYNHLMREAVQRRYELLPYIYTECRRTYDTGVALCRPMYIEFSEKEEAYTCPSQYQFGSEFVVRPITEPMNEEAGLVEVSTWLPEGEWVDCGRGRGVPGGGVVSGKYTLEEVPVFCRKGTVIPGALHQSRAGHACPRDLLLTVYSGSSSAYEMYEDDGTSQAYLGSEFVKLPIALEHRAEGLVLSLGPVAGHYSGFSPIRALTVRLPASFPPDEAVLNKTVLNKAVHETVRGSAAAFHFDGERAWTEVRLTEVHLQERIELDLRFDSQLKGEMLNGFAGALRRVRLAFEAARTLEVPWERELAWWVQTGSRLSAVFSAQHGAHSPADAKQLLQGFTEWLHSLVREYEAIKRDLATHRRYRPSNLPAFERAWALLMDAESLL